MWLLSNIKKIEYFSSPKLYEETIEYIKELVENKGFIVIEGNCKLGEHERRTLDWWYNFYYDRMSEMWKKFTCTVNTYRGGGSFKGRNYEFLFVALGGAIGAMARYAISLIPVKTGFLILTLITNIAGAILIGFIVGLTSNKDNISGNTVLFWKTGVCGGFTTFSTFSLEAFNLLDNKQYTSGGLYCIKCCMLYIRYLMRKEVGFCGKVISNEVLKIVIRRTCIFD